MAYEIWNDEIGCLTLRKKTFACFKTFDKIDGKYH